jgi:hypothetical protein
MGQWDILVPLLLYNSINTTQMALQLSIKGQMIMQKTVELMAIRIFNQPAQIL